MKRDAIAYHLLAGAPCVPCHSLGVRFHSEGPRAVIGAPRQPLLRSGLIPHAAIRDFRRTDLSPERGGTRPAHPADPRPRTRPYRSASSLGACSALDFTTVHILGCWGIGAPVFQHGDAPLGTFGHRADDFPPGIQLTATGTFSGRRIVSGFGPRAAMATRFTAARMRSRESRSARMSRGTSIWSPHVGQQVELVAL